MSTSKQRLASFHAREYVRATMADRLIAEGFVSTNDDFLHWYRLVNRDTVHYVLFYADEPNLPLDLFVGFGCIPLFLEPVFYSNVCIRRYIGGPGIEVFHPGYVIMKNHNRFAYSDQILVTCPADEHRGADILDKVIAVFNQTQCAKACYEYHKYTHIRAAKELQISNPYNFVSADFADEVIFWNDEEVLPFLPDVIDRELSSYHYNSQQRKLERYEESDLLRWEQLKEAFDSNLDKYRDYLESRKKRTIQLLAKKVGIVCQGDGSPGT